MALFLGPLPSCILFALMTLAPGEIKTHFDFVSKYVPSKLPGVCKVKVWAFLEALGFWRHWFSRGKVASVSAVFDLFAPTSNSLTVSFSHVSDYLGTPVQQ